MPKIITFSQGPEVCVTLEFHRLTFKRSSLSLSKAFECKIVGQPDEKSQEDLLAFMQSYSQKRDALIQLPLSELSLFRQKILKHLQKAPFGSTLTYGQLAMDAGHLGAARAVGTACHFNPFPLFIPCHRVVANKGKIGGFACDLQIKKLLLEFEIACS
jgi:O-6-methylguanine DNA methyltransferase